MSTVDLIPVVELVPSDFGSADCPDSNSDEETHRRQMNAYWKSCLAESEIHDLELYAPREILTRISEIQIERTIQTICRVWFDQATEDATLSFEDMDIFAPISGGYALEAHGRTILPGCCCDLSELDSWCEAAAYRGNDWQMVWIGHPWTIVRYVNDRLEFAKPAEYEAMDDATAYITVASNDLLNAIAKAVAAIESFRERLSAALVTVTGDRSLAANIAARWTATAKA